MKKNFDILIVEDSKTQAENLRFILENKSYEVINAFNGNEALEVLTQWTPRIIISDIVMPEMDGYTLCSKVKANNTLKKIPFILLTSLADTEDIIKGLVCGADSFITKPFDREFLLSKVEYLILNFELRKNRSTEMGLEILFGGKKHLITSDRLQILDLLISTYESAVIKNKELTAANKDLKFSKNQLAQFNKNLEITVEKRTGELQLANEELQKEIEERNLTGKKQALIVKILSILNRPNEWKNLINDILSEIKSFIGIEAIAIRLRNGDDFPYFNSQGYSFGFLKNENSICIYDTNGNPTKDKEGKLILDCMCGKIILGKSEPNNPYFTKSGSFWTNSLISATNNAGTHKIKGFTRFRCSKEGSQSFALIPVINGTENIGLIQLSDKKPGLFTPELISFLELIASSIGIAYKRVQNETLIKESETRYKKLFDEDLTGDFIKTPDGKIVTCNKAFAKIFGFKSPEDAIGQDFKLLYADKNDHDLMLKEIQSAGKLSESNMWMKNLNGNSIHIIWNSVGNFNKKGKLTEILGYVFDDTNRKLAEEEIHTERKLLRTFIENIPDAFYVKDAQGRKLIANRADLINIGANTEEEILGKTDLEIFNNEIGNRGYQDDMKVLKNKVPIINREEVFYSKNNTPKWLITSKIPLFDSQGNVTGLVGIGRDITDRVIASNELTIALENAQVADRLKSSFLATMSHELRTPLNAVIGFSSLVDENTPIKSVLEYNKIISSSGQQLLEIIENIFHFSMIETGVVQIQKSSVILYKILDDALIRIKEECKKQNKSNIEIIFNTENCAPSLVIETDETKLQKIINYLLDNALKFTKQGKIEFGGQKVLKDNNLFLEFYVKDTGIGIPKDKQDIIFEIFRQADDSNTRSYGGAGLGLTLSKKLIELLGGSIRLESETGKGSTFYFNIPTKELASAPEKIKETKIKGGKTILIVEDDEINFSLLKLYLKNLNCKIHWVERGDTAVDFCKNNPDIDLILMDVNLPGISGNEATIQIKKMCPNLPIIIQSAYSMDKDKKLVNESGCDDYILKPIKKELLMEKIQKFI